jgi:hypothetical protein
MCPACIASAALVVSSVVSTGGLTAVLVKKFGVKRGVKTIDSSAQTKGGDDASETSRGERHGASESRIA